MAYTPSGFKIKNSPDNFGGLVVDSNRIAMPYGNYMQSVDATGTPLKSPISNGSGSGITLKVPQAAVTCTVYIASSVTGVIGEDSTFTYGMFVPTATAVTIPCARQQYIYLLPSSGTNTIYFFFTMI